MGIKMDTDKVRNSTVSKFSKKAKVITTLSGVIIIALGVNMASSYQAKQKVDIVSLNTSVPQDGRITEDMLEKTQMFTSEFEKQGVYKASDGSKKRAIVTWEDRKDLVNAYASYYIRNNTPIYWDSLTAESAKDYSYLYKMDGELLKIGVAANEFGRMLVPGDKINVRASYTEPDFTLPDQKTYEKQQSLGMNADTSVTRNVKLFNSVTVLDILNSEGESIFDIYYELLSLPKTQQLTIAESDDFKKLVDPKDILLNVTPEEADRYMEIEGLSAKYMMTLLPRSSGNAITEALNDLDIGLSVGKSK